MQLGKGEIDLNILSDDSIPDGGRSGGPGSSGPPPPESDRWSALKEDSGPPPNRGPSGYRGNDAG